MEKKDVIKEEKENKPKPEIFSEPESKKKKSIPKLSISQFLNVGKDLKLEKLQIQAFTKYFSGKLHTEEEWKSILKEELNKRA